MVTRICSPCVCVCLTLVLQKCIAVTEQLAAKKHSAHEHYWPQPRGGPGHYSRTSYGLPRELLQRGNLTESLAWTWTHELGLDALVWGTLIDKDRSVYIIGTGIHKLSHDGKLQWSRSDLGASAQMSSLVGNSLCTMTMFEAVFSCMSLETGENIWSRQVAESTAANGDMITSHNGVVLAGVDALDMGFGQSGTCSKRVLALNSSTGDELWTYEPDCGLWNFMALFPDEDTVNVMDSCGGLYRLGLFNGSQLWKRAPDVDAYTDGGATLGLDGSVYTCSNEPGSKTQIMKSVGMEGVRGRVRKFNQSTGEMIWERQTEKPCLNFPAVSPDGKTLVASDGAIVISPPTKYMTDGMGRKAIDQFYGIQASLLENKRQNAYWGVDNVDGSITGFDTQTGALKWVHEVEPWWGMAFARDEERAYHYVTGQGTSPFCGPPHWSAPTIDSDGNIYIGRSDGYLYIYNPNDGSEVKFDRNDGMLVPGLAFAPGLMVVPSCSSVHVFKY